MNPLLYTDGYKVDHRRQYPDKTTLVYSNWTPRKSRIDGIEEVVFFGLQYFIKRYVIDEFQKNFFDQPKKGIVGEYAFTMYNTKPEFFWLTNYFETIISTTVWMPCNSATIAKKYRQILDKYAEETSSAPDFVDWQGHDFSMRGMAGLEAALVSAAGHLLSFTGSDTIPAIDFLEQYYRADAGEELVGGSVAATEHSVMCMGTKTDEVSTFKRLITEVYPHGVVSIVSDTWDLWQVLTEYLPALKEDVLARNGKVVIRPDSGDPVDIICGNPNGKTEEEKKGVIQLLWDTFGGTTNAKGYKELDTHIGAIYGDSITLDRATRICERLKQNGYASTNVVLGVGSFTYQYNTDM